MEYKCFHFEFENDLTEEQERIFISAIKALRDTTIENARKMKNQLNNPIVSVLFRATPYGKMSNVAIKRAIEDIEKNMDKYLIFEKKGNKNYILKYSIRDLSSFIRDSKKKEDSLLMGLNKFIFPQMKTYPKVSISVIEEKE